MGHRRSATFLVTVVLAVACGSETSPVGRWSHSVEQIGDTTIVRTGAVDDSQALLAVREVLRIGMAEGPDEYIFGRITHVVPGRQEGLYVWDRGTAELREFDKRGRFVRRIGRVGSGPGEYRFGAGLTSTSGRVVLWDGGNGRVNVYDSSGAFLDSWQYSGSIARLEMVSDTAGNVYVPESINGHDALVSVRLTDGVGLDTLIAPVLGPQPSPLRAISPDGGTMIQRSVPFAPRPIVVFHPHGFFVGGVGDQYRVRLFRPGGELRIERQSNPIAVSHSKREELENMLTAGLRRTNPAWRWDGPKIPDERPFFVDLHTASDGTIWVRRSVAPEDQLFTKGFQYTGEREEPDAFDVYALDGTFCGHVVLPANVRVLHLGGRTLWATLEDELGVPYLVQFEVGREPRRPELANGGTSLHCAGYR